MDYLFLIFRITSAVINQEPTVRIKRVKNKEIEIIRIVDQKI